MAKTITYFGAAQNPRGRVEGLYVRREAGRPISQTWTGVEFASGREACAWLARVNFPQGPTCDLRQDVRAGFEARARGWNLREANEAYRRVYGATRDHRRAIQAYCSGNRWAMENARAVGNLPPGE